MCLCWKEIIVSSRFESFPDLALTCSFVWNQILLLCPFQKKLKIKFEKGCTWIKKHINRYLDYPYIVFQLMYSSNREENLPLCNLDNFLLTVSVTLPILSWQRISHVKTSTKYKKQRRNKRVASYYLKTTTANCLVTLRQGERRSNNQNYLNNKTWLKLTHNWMDAPWTVIDFHIALIASIKTTGMAYIIHNTVT